MSQTSLKSDIDSDRFALIQEQEELIQLIEDRLTRLQLISNIIKSPFFAIIKVELNNKEVVYFIGKYALIDDNMEVLISDWRSNIGQIFYENSSNLHELLIRDKKHKVELKEKIKVTYRDSRLTTISDMLDDQYDLKESFSKDLEIRKSGRFKDIITTIQEEQSNIIRQAPNTSIAIQGCAGSGKTSIAIHRLSHVYFNSEIYHTKPENTVYITPNSLFADYLIDVKTSLGLEGTQFKTYLQWGIDILFNKERIINNELIVHPKLIQNSQEYNPNKETLRNFASSYIHTHILKHLKKIHKSLKKNFYPLTPINKIIKNLEQEENLVESISKYKQFIKKTEGITSKDRSYGKRLLLKSNPYIIYEEYLKANKLKKSYSTKLVKNTNDLYHLYVNFSQSDIAPLLELTHLFFDKATYTSQMIIIDEVQNYTQNEIKAMLNLSKHNNFMIIGDVHQQTRKHGIPRISLKEEYLSPYVNPNKTSEINIQKCYRTTEAIMKVSYKPFGKEIKSNFAANQYFRAGNPIKTYNSDNLNKALSESIRNASKQEFNTIAVTSSDIANLNKAFNIASKLENKYTFEILPINETNYKKGIFFLEDHMLAGIEFDMLIYLGDLQAINKFTSWNHASRLHVALSRAMHELVLCEI